MQSALASLALVTDVVRCPVTFLYIDYEQMQLEDKCPPDMGLFLKTQESQGGKLRQPLPVVSIPLVLGTDSLLTGPR